MLKSIGFFAAVSSVALVLAGCGDDAPQFGADPVDSGPGAQGELAPPPAEDALNPLPSPEPDIVDSPPGSPPPPPPELGEGAPFTPVSDYGNPRGRADLEFRELGSATAWLFEDEDGVRVYVLARGMSPGEYAIHVHETGDCSAPDYASAGDHLGETAGQVLDDRPDDFDAGALPDLEIGQDGSGTLDAVLDALAFEDAGEGEWAIFDADGASVVIHRFSTGDEPPGGDNPRIACGEIFPSDL